MRRKHKLLFNIIEVIIVSHQVYCIQVYCIHNNVIGNTINFPANKKVGSTGFQTKVGHGWVCRVTLDELHFS